MSIFDHPTLQRTSANIRMKLTLLETRIPGLHFCRCEYGSIFMQILVVGSKTQVNATERIIAVQGHFRVNQGRWFWYQTKARVWLIVTFVVSRTVRRYGGLLVENRQLVPTPPPFNVLARGDPLRILRWTWYPQKLEWWGYHVVKKSWS